MINRRKEKKEELAKNRTWKAVGASNNVCLNCLETKSENRRRRRRRRKKKKMQSKKQMTDLVGSEAVLT